ncbi:MULTISPECIES: WbqC family protein [unclassified Kaistella]|uniref:WbqC family protein n=1 Tax=unclassified Kaistella TaxID=2762626 RepID=UPI002734DF07|nr:MULTISPECIES: WbqC family protein [unclassified Kaistella]MCZ2084444.1 WbqC family protein [Flavobacteriales bacterium]MDP2454861.1 WbqC family protein [Kaistella sp. SH11-4b]MDP2457598.1 WbqC family protein [Kaistella sp. SH40-3]MDP2460358.1 WbqC family protein [Kaistella sp. SH19-2b]
MQILLPIFYLPPISWFYVFLQDDAEIIFEQFENFPKQTYRNRANIYGANGKLSLIIPMNHNGTRVIKDIQTSNREKWQQLHWKSIKTAYQTSPYFDYYEDRLQEIYTFKTNSLIEFNLNALKVIQKILKTEQSFSLNDEFFKEPAILNYRDHFSAKSDTPFEMQEYFQSFSDKYGYLKDLSIIDLICNKGPESLTYIKNIKTEIDIK